MKKRILSILLVCCMVLTMLPTAAFAAVSDSLGNTPKENQAILEQLSALTGGSSDQVLSMLNALGLLDEDGNFKVDQTITLDGQVLTLAAVMELLENPATDLTRIADVDGTPVALGDLKTMIQIEQELQRIKDTYFSGREFAGEALENLNSLMEQLELQGISLRYSASATKPEGVETVDMSGMMSQTLGNLANNTWNSGPFTVYRGKPAGFSYRIQKGQLKSKTNKKTSGGEVIDAYSYSYYFDGNILSENNRTFTYDKQGRLSNEAVSGAGAYQISYTYDRFGNRAAMNRNGTATSYTYDQNNRLVQEVSGDQYTFYHYDDRGNLYSKRTDERGQAGGLTRVDTFGELKNNVASTVELYAYDGFNRLSEVRKGGITAQYTYLNQISICNIVHSVTPFLRE